MRHVLLIAVLSSVEVLDASAQARDGVYAAPGMLVTRSRSPTPAAGVPAKTKSKAVGGTPEIVSPVFPRFWHLSGVERRQQEFQYQDFLIKTVQKNLQAAKSSLYIGNPGLGLEGTAFKIFVRFTVLPDGTVAKAVVLPVTEGDAVDMLAKFKLFSPSPAVEAELIRVASKAHFAPSTSPLDSVAVGQWYVNDYSRK
ncbi:hypothetical protein ACFST9_06550 [Hymenobacter monticola]